MILEPTELGGFMVELELWLFELKYYFGMLAILDGMGEVGGFPEKIIDRILEPAKLLEVYARLATGECCEAAEMEAAGCNRRKKLGGGQNGDSR